MIIDIIRFNELLLELGNLGIDEGKQNEAVELFKKNRAFIWQVLYNMNIEKITGELERVIEDKMLIGSIIQIFVIVAFEAMVRDEE